MTAKLQAINVKNSLNSQIPNGGVELLARNRIRRVVFILLVAFNRSNRLGFRQLQSRHPRLSFNLVRSFLKERKAMKLHSSPSNEVARLTLNVKSLRSTVRDDERARVDGVDEGAVQ